ncbi:hypothetical protein JCM10207_004483 [Rhodosporidiobolus poonsookiae]
MFQRVSYQPPMPAGCPSDPSNPPSSDSQLGTVLFEGPVPPTKGVWLGVEWDEPSRGKHSGVYEKTGERFFQTRVEGAGSFLRPDAKGLDRRGKTFKQALFYKYLDVDLLAPASAEPGDAVYAETADPHAEALTSKLYATSSNFEVEVVLSSKVNSRFKQLGRLREIGLEWENISRACEEGSEAELARLGQELSRLKVLDMSYSLIPTLEEAAKICAVLPRLRTLALNSNRFQPIPASLSLYGLEQLTTLQLNSTLLSWNELLSVSHSLTNLVDLQFGFNRLRGLGGTASRADRDQSLLPRLERLNLESNELSGWSDVVEELALLPSLSELVIASNRFDSLQLKAGSSSTSLRRLRHLSLTDNLLSSWTSSVEALAASSPSAFPSLTSLRLSGNPLVTPPIDDSFSPDVDEQARLLDRHALRARLGTIARFAALTELEGTPVTAAERGDAERFWLEQLDKDEEKEAELSEWARGRADELRTKHGASATATAAPAASSGKAPQKPTLKDRLIQLHLRLDPVLPSPSSSTLSVLPTLRTLLLRTQISRLVGKPLPKTKFRLVAVLQGGEDGKEVRVEIPPNEEGKELSWWGLGDGDAVEVLAL